MSRANRKPAGGFARATGPFALDPLLTAPGLLLIDEAADLVTQDWAVQAAAGTVRAETVNVHTTVLRGFVQFCRTHSITAVVDVDSALVWKWMGSLSVRDKTHPTVNQMELRRSVLRAFFHTLFRLGLTDDNPTIGVNIPERPERVVAPLSADDIAALKRAADYDVLAGRHPGEHRAGSSKTAPAVALALLGAQGGEPGAVTCRDIDLLNQSVWLSEGGARYRDRWVPIDDEWCFGVLAARVAYLAREFPDDWQDRRICYEPAEKETRRGELDRRRAAISMMLTKAMDRASIRQPGRNRVASIADSVAVRVFDTTGSIEQVAVRLGITSLDTAAQIVRYDWAAKHAFTPGTAG